MVSLTPSTLFGGELCRLEVVGMGVTAAVTMHVTGWHVLQDVLSLDPKRGPSPETLRFIGRSTHFP